MLVAVTGADGFIGSHLVERLLAEGIEVRALAQYNSFDSSGHLKHPTDGLDIWYGDVRDLTQMHRFVKGCNVIYHLAALISVPYSFQSPEQFVETNVRGTLNMIEAALGSCAKLVHVSTSEVYGTATRVPMDELHRIHPQSPYAASKVAADAFVAAAQCTHGLPVTIVRPFNTFGPRQSQRAVIPRIIVQFTNAEEGSEILLGDLRPVRDFTYVTDTAAAIAMARGVRDIGPFNIGTGVGRTIRQTVREIAKHFNRKIHIAENFSARPQQAEVEELVCYAGRYFLETGWTPEVAFSDGIKRTVEWFSEHNIKETRNLI